MPIDHLVLQLFESLASEADLQRLIDDQIQENLYLEFKKKKNASAGDLDDSDKRQFSRALSGFANSGGGILIWGIEGDHSERASSLRPIADVFRFQSGLKKSLLNSTQPVVDDVRVEIIVALTSPDRGYVRCLIPQSERTPHRAMLWDREYFKRSTEGFYRLEHFDLEDMFGRRPVPRLQLMYHVRKGSSVGSWKGSEQDVDIHLSVANEGRGSARAPFVELGANAPFEITASGISSGVDGSIFRWLRESSTKAKFLGRSELVIHPETSLEFAIVRRRFWDKEPNTGDLTLQARFAAEYGRASNVELHFPVADLLKAVGWNAGGPA